MSVIEEHFSEWLGASPCFFARVFASRQLVRPVELTGPLTRADLDSLDVLLDTLARAQQLGLFIWPSLRTAEDVVDVLSSLLASSRWSCCPVPWKKHPRADTTQVGLTWKTANADQSSVMGFAPLGSMPVTRRSPYVAIAVWPGGKLNTKHRSKAGEVGFIDCVVPEARKSEYTYDSLFDKTNERVIALLSAQPPDDYETLRKVAFCLPSAAMRGQLPGFDI